MAKNTKGIQLNLGPVKAELESFAQGFGALTTQLNAFMLSMGNAGRASQQFSQQTSGLSSTAMQTPVGMQTMAAANVAGFQQVTYGQRFHELTQAAASRQDVANMGLASADADIVRRSRDAMEAVSVERMRNAAQANKFGWFQTSMQQMAAMQPVVQGLTTQMKQAGWTPAEVAEHWRKTGPEASNAFMTMDNRGLGSGRDYSYMAKAQGLMGRPLDELSSMAVADRQRIDNNVARTAERARQAQEAAAERSREETKRAFNTSFQVGDNARQANTRAAVTGDNNYRYGLGDIVSAKGNLANSSAQVDAIKAFTDRLKSSSDVLDKGLGVELGKTIEKFGQLSNRFDKLNSSLQNQEVGTEKYQKTLAELAKTSGQLNQTYEDLKESSKQGGGPNGGDGGGNLSRGERVQRFMAGTAAVVGAGLGIADGIMSTRRTMLENSVNSERSAISAEAGLAQMSFRSKREQTDMTNIENRLKYRAESVLSASQLADNPLLGMSGRQLALAKSAHEAQMSMAIQKTDSTYGVIKGGVKVGLGMGMLGAAAAGATTGVGATVGVVAGSQGISTIVSGASDIAGGQENQYNQIVKGGISGTLAGKLLGATHEQAIQNARNASAGLAVSVIQGAEDMQRSAIMANPEILEGMQGLEDTRLARLRGVALIGRAATRGLDSVSGDFLAANKLGAAAVAESKERGEAAEGVAQSTIDQISTGKRGAGNLTKYRNERLNGTSKENILFALQGTESNFNPNAQSATSTARGLYQMLAGRNQDVALAGARERMKNPSMTMEQMFSSADAQNAGMSALLDTYQPGRLMAKFPGLNKSEALAFEHLVGRGPSGMKAITKYMENGKKGLAPDGTDMAKYASKYSAFEAAGEVISKQNEDLSEHGTRESVKLKMISLRGGQKMIEEATRGVDQVSGERGRQEAMDRYFDNSKNRTDVVSRLGLSYAEFADKQNVASNFIGQSAAGDRLASTAMTSQLIGMSRSGSGSFESLLGNLQGLNQTRGGQNNFEQLKEIFASGTAAGFDKSRTAQQFVQTVTGLSQALDITNTSSVASNLSIGSRIQSSNGRGDEKSMSDAATNTQAYARVSGATSGFMGSRKYAALVSAGVDYSHGLSMYNEMSGDQMVSGMSELGQAGSLEGIKSPRLRALVDQAMSENGGDFAAAKAKVSGIIGKVRGAENTASNAMNGAFNSKNNPLSGLDRLGADFKKLSPAQKIRKLQQMNSIAAVQGAPMMGGFAAAQGAFTARVQELGLLDGQDMETYEKSLASNIAAAEDEAKINLSSDINGNVRSVAGNQLGHANKSQLGAFFANKNAVVKGVTADTYQKLQDDPNFKNTAAGQAATKTLAKVTPEDLGIGKSGPRQMDTSEAQGTLGKTFDAATAKILADQIAIGLGKSPLGATLVNLNQTLQAIKLKLN